jgi:hypothetical protein
MRRYRLTIIACFIVVAAYGFTLMGCMTKFQSESEKAYYQAKVDIAKERQGQPIFRMTPIVAGQPIVISNGTVEIFAQPQSSDANFAQYQHRDFTPAWIPSLLNAAAPLGILYGGSLLMKSIPNSGGNITGSYNTKTNTATTTSTNTATTSTFSNTASGGSVANMGSGQANLITTEAPVVVVPPVTPTVPVVVVP